MDVTQIRRANLRGLIDRYAKGEPVKFAEMLDHNLDHLRQMLMDPSKKSARNMGAKVARKFESRLGLEHGYLDRAGYIAEDSKIYDSGLEPGPSFHGMAPVISWVRAGDADLAIDLFAPGDADEWVPGPPVSHSKSTYVLRVRGDSMEAPYGKSYPNGCLIYVDPEQCGGVGVGDRVIAKINGRDAVTFKQLAEDNGRMFLKPLNPQYPSNYEEFRVLGKVIFKGEPE